MITFLLAFGLILTTAPLLASDAAAPSTGGADSAESIEISAIKKFFTEHNREQIAKPAEGWGKLFFFNFFEHLRLQTKQTKSADDIEEVFYTRIIIDNVDPITNARTQTMHYGLCVIYKGGADGICLAFKKDGFYMYHQKSNRTIAYTTFGSDYTVIGNASHLGCRAVEARCAQYQPAINTVLLPFFNLLEE